MKKLYSLVAKLNDENSPIFDLIVFMSEIYFRIFFRKFYKKELVNFLRKFELRGKTYEIRKIDERFALELYRMLSNLRTEFMPPHRNDLASLKRILKNKSFFATGIFDGEKLIGYGLGRFFPLRRAVPAVVIAEGYQGKGLYVLWSRIMFKVVKEDFREYKFNMFSTVDKRNKIAINNNLKTGFKIVLDAGDFLVFRA